MAGATSVGIVLAPRDGNTPDELLKHADLALYRAKKRGPERFASSRSATTN
ncbi:diguanylate cyclase domain-containing protein [Bradyrhizobium sp. BR 1432]|uniref:diguanylate cyclase domain-containing protein n=1 Tax=Bradyrhizobium sp. BR 1432 TaxID=3447966 RepID=UPI003EE6FCA1